MCCCCQLWRSLRDFVAQSHAWTEDAILDDDGAVLLNIEAIRAEVDDYATKAYKASKANKDVSLCPACCAMYNVPVPTL